MLIKRIFLLLLLSVSFKASFAQRGILNDAPSGVIQYSPPTFFGRGHFYVDGKKESLKQISARLINDPASASEFELYRKYKKRTARIGITEILIIVAAAIVGNSSDKYQDAAGAVMLGAALGLPIPIIIFDSKSNKHFWRSIQLYNQQFE